MSKAFTKGVAGSLPNEPPEKAKSFLDKWYFWATHSRIPAIIKVAKTIRKHQDGILRWFTSGINNGILEGINWRKS